MSSPENYEANRNPLPDLSSLEERLEEWRDLLQKQKELADSVQDLSPELQEKIEEFLQIHAKRVQEIFQEIQRKDSLVSEGLNKIFVGP